MSSGTPGGDDQGTDTPFEVTIRHDGDVTIMSVGGELDMTTAPQLGESVDAVLTQDPSAVVIDLTDVQFLASAGMSVLVDAHQQFSGTAQFGVVADGPHVGRPLKLVGLDERFTIYDSVADALVGLRSTDSGEKTV